MVKTLVLYVFHIFNERVTHFIKNAIFFDENIDFIFISNSLENKDYLVNLPDYVKVIYRENIGYDFGGWSEALLKDNLYTNYDYFIFVNSSVIGPFLKDKNIKWTDIYINGLVDNIKLFGSTINTIKKPLEKSHVQSYIFSMNKETLEYLIECEIFSITNLSKTFDDCVWNKEVLMSRKIIEKGWNIGSLLKCYQNVDFTFKSKSPRSFKIQFLDDIMFPKYKNVLWNIYDLVFIKGNRVKI
jgi:hypothetical protein